MQPKRCGNCGWYFIVLKWLSENGLSIEVCGRLWDLVDEGNQMAPVAALAAGFSVIRRHVPRLLVRSFRVRFEAPTVGADHRPPALYAGEEKLKAERNSVRQHASARDRQCAAKFDFRRRVAALSIFVDPVRISDLVACPVRSFGP